MQVQVQPSRREGSLINPGPSERGWHRIESMLRCPRLYALQHIDGIEFPLTRPLVNGIMLHVALAHHYKRLECEQRGTDANEWLSPEGALAEMVAKNSDSSPLWKAGVDQVFDAFCAYAQNWDAESWTVLAVEEELRANLGGGRFLYTQRPDLIVEDFDERVWIVDHKSAYRLVSKTLQQHILDGQFLGYQMFGFAKYGNRFAGVIVNRVKLSTPHDFDRTPIEPAPAALRQFTNSIVEAEERILQYGEDSTDFPMVLSNQVCYGKYGQCPAFDLCRFGSR